MAQWSWTLLVPPIPEAIAERREERRALLLPVPPSLRLIWSPPHVTLMGPSDCEPEGLAHLAPAVQPLTASRAVRLTGGTGPPPGLSLPEAANLCCRTSPGFQ